VSKDELVEEWLTLAIDDLAAAEHLFATMKRRPLEIVCFHCQQAGEKALKAVLQAKGREIPRVHDLLELRRQISDSLFDSADIDRACSHLTIFGVSFRYPGKLDLEETDAETALSEARRILELAKAAIAAH